MLHVKNKLFSAAFKGEIGNTENNGIIIKKNEFDLFFNEKQDAKIIILNALCLKGSQPNEDKYLQALKHEQYRIPFSVIREHVMNKNKKGILSTIPPLFSISH